MQKYAILSMDVEDWYHLDYLTADTCDTTISLLDGLDIYTELLEEQGIRSSFFVLAEIADQVAGRLRALHQRGHDISCHGFSHARPLTLAPEQFATELTTARARLQDLIGSPVPGFRASCFSLDRQRLELVRQAGFTYDASKIAFGDHPLYGDLDLTGFQEVQPNIYADDGFMEFETSTLPVLGRMLPVSGGGYLRMFPWMLMRVLATKYLQLGHLYVLYIHPFELSPAPSPLAHAGQVSWRHALRFDLGRKQVAAKLRALISLLRAQGYTFTTFADLQADLQKGTA